MRADITPARTSPVPQLDNSGPPSAHSNKSSWLLEQTIVFLPFRITKAENFSEIDFAALILSSCISLLEIP